MYLYSKSLYINYWVFRDLGLSQGAVSLLYDKINLKDCFYMWLLFAVVFSRSKIQISIDIAVTSCVIAGISENIQGLMLCEKFMY
jgi:hypothetical protein